MMVSRKVLGLLSICSLLAFASCSETISVDQQRREDNEKMFLSYENNSNGFEKVSLPGAYGDRYIYMKKTTKGTGTESPRSTDFIKMHYQGALLSSYQSGSPVYFDGNLGTHENFITPSRVSGYISGMSIALQNMVVGDKAEIIVPWYLGYGAQSIGSIPSYSALYFQVELLTIVGDQAQ